MASILMASVPIQGHVGPLLAVARHLVQRGDQVRFVTGVRFADEVRATGARFVPLPEAADFNDQLDVEQRFPERRTLSGAKALAFDVEHIFVRPARPQYDVLSAQLAAQPADVVLVEPAFAGAAFLLGRPRSQRPAVLVCGVLPLSLASRDTAPYGMGLAPSRWLNAPRNALLAALARPLFARATKVADGLYREVHGRGMPFQVLDWSRLADGIVQFTVPGFEYPRSDAPAGLVFAGPMPNAITRAPLPAWWPELDGHRPVVHLTQGTFANKDYRQLIAPALQALAGEPVLVVVSTGGRPLDTLAPLPANARAAEFLPYGLLLPRTDLYVTNGGYGGVQYALSHGVPIVATGGKEDKPEVGARVAWSGVGLCLRSEHPDASSLRRVMLRVLHDPRYRQASQRLAAQAAGTSGLEVLCAAIDRHVRPAASTSRAWRLAA